MSAALSTIDARHPSGSRAARAAAFLDRDGVLIVDSGYPHRDEDLVLISGAADAVAELNAHGYIVIVVTNQAGIARGYFDEATLHRFNGQIARALDAKGARIDAVYFCPFHPDAATDAYRHEDHPDRKPNPGMLLKAAADHNIDMTRSFLIGDQATDVEAARRAGVEGFLFEEDNLYQLTVRILASRKETDRPARVAHSLP